MLYNPDCFEKESVSDWEHLTLTLGIFYELSKGHLSYWYPYLRLMLDSAIIRDPWTC